MYRAPVGLVSNALCGAGTSASIAAAICSGSVPVGALQHFSTLGSQQTLDTLRALRSAGADRSSPSSSSCCTSHGGTPCAPHQVKPFSSTAVACSAAAQTSAATADVEAGRSSSPAEQPQPARRTFGPLPEIPQSARSALPEDEHALLGAGRRRSRALHVTHSGSSGGEQAPASAGEAEAGEIREVFNKLVGGLTKSGQKGVATRIVLDAMQVMRRQLKEGKLDEIK